MTTIRLHDTLTRTKRPFEPIDPQNVRMYVCGPTVYDRAHLGNARPVIVFDVLYRLLRHVYGAEHVTYVRNITDVDDKIIARAEETGRPIEAITEETTRWFHEDMAALGALPPTHEPRATDHVGASNGSAGMIAMIRELTERRAPDGEPFAYEAEGHVLFRVAADPDYGVLSGRSVEDMIAGARVEVAPYKRDPMDFVLWKPSSEDQPGWPSPWGRGRPGWHIECSAMSRRLLGQEFDIHGGGTDLLFPHHENEIAQSTCAGDPFARYWLHNEMLQVEGKKMSKSLGNFFTVRDLLEQGIPGEVIRFVFLGTHYRSPMDWTEKKVSEAAKNLDFMYRMMGDEPLDERWPPDDRVEAALLDDLNTPLAIVNLLKLAGEVDRTDSSGQEVAAVLKRSAHLLGLLPMAASAWFSRGLNKVEASTANELIETLLAERLAARKARDFARADALRDQLVAAGVVIMDPPNATEKPRWTLASGFDPAKLQAIR